MPPGALALSSYSRTFGRRTPAELLWVTPSVNLPQPEELLLEEQVIGVWRGRTWNVRVRTGGIRRGLERPSRGPGQEPVVFLGIVHGDKVATQACSRGLSVSPGTGS